MFQEMMDRIYPEFEAIREDLHRHPELSWQENRTSAIVAEKLRSYGIDDIRIMAKTGVIAVLKGGKGEGKCIALRADIDALPVSEETLLPFASENPGVMHACGHDIHTANMLAVAKMLAEHRDEFCGTVKFIFQPAEEAACPDNPRGGAWYLCDGGVMEDPHVDAIVGMHVTPSLDKPGTIGLKKGIVTSGFDVYRFDVYGKTGHGSQPQTGNDAILAISQLIVLLQQVVSRNIDPLRTAVLTIGTISGGTAINIIPGEATCGGVFRYLDNDTADEIKTHTMDIVRGVESVSGCRIEVKALRGYACVDNDGAMTDLTANAITKELGAGAIDYLKEPTSGSEDFSQFTLGGVPGCFMWVNAEPCGDSVHPLHSSKCAMKTEIIKKTAPAIARVAVEYLNG